MADVKKTAATKAVKAVWVLLKAFVAWIAQKMKEPTGAFFNINDSDNHKEVAEKVAYTGLKRVVYAVADYWLMAASAAFVILADKWLGYGWLGLFLLMWGFDLVVAIAFILFAKYSGEDITLGSDYRRAVDVLHAKSKFVGYLSFGVVIVKAAFWDGPEQIVMFFKKELKRDGVVMLALLGLTAIQAAIWTPIYVLGFDTVSELVEYLWKLL